MCLSLCFHALHCIWWNFSGAMKVAGEIVHGQATADPDASIEQRMAIGVGECWAGDDE